MYGHVSNRVLLQRLLWFRGLTVRLFNFNFAEMIQHFKAQSSWCKLATVSLSVCLNSMLDGRKPCTHSTHQMPELRLLFIYIYTCCTHQVSIIPTKSKCWGNEPHRFASSTSPGPASCHLPASLNELISALKPQRVVAKHTLRKFSSLHPNHLA